jgi:hypothetical protein
LGQRKWVWSYFENFGQAYFVVQLFELAVGLSEPQKGSFEVGLEFARQPHIPALDWASFVTLQVELGAIATHP